MFVLVVEPMENIEKNTFEGYLLFSPRMFACSLADLTGIYKLI
jgi:hypothetical protein